MDCSVRLYQSKNRKKGKTKTKKKQELLEQSVSVEGGCECLWPWPPTRSEGDYLWTACKALEELRTVTPEASLSPTAKPFSRGGFVSNRTLDTQQHCVQVLVTVLCFQLKRLLVDIKQGKSNHCFSIHWTTVLTKATNFIVRDTFALHSPNARIYVYLPFTENKITGQ